MKLLTARNRSLLRELVITDFKLRYQNSVLGYLWSLIRPLALFTILYLVFSKFFNLGADIPHYPAYLLLGIVLWNFFVEATSSGMSSILSRGDLIRKVSIPKYTIVLSTTISALINLGINLLVVAVFMVFGGVAFRAEILLLPLLIAELFTLSIAISFLLAALYVRYRDFAYIWELGLQILFYGTPIIYPLSRVPARFHTLVLMNPLAQIIQDARHSAITPRTGTIGNVLPTYWLLVPLGLIALTVWVASLYFKKQSKSFAENI